MVDAVDAYAVIPPFRKKNISISPDFKNGGWKPIFLFRKGYFFKGRTVKLLGCIFKKPTNKAVLMLTSQNVPKYLGELNPLPQLSRRICLSPMVRPVVQTNKIVQKNHVWDPKTQRKHTGP